MLGLAAFLTFLLPSKVALVDAQLARAARLIESSNDRDAALRDPALKALLGAIVAMPGQRPQRPTEGGTFAMLDVLVESTDASPLTWLVELELPGLIAGIEGGDRPFDALPEYDPAALDEGIVRIAGATSGDLAPSLDGEWTRIASLTIRRTGAELPMVTISRGVGPDGESLTLSVRCVERAKDGIER